MMKDFEARVHTARHLIAVAEDAKADVWAVTLRNYEDAITLSVNYKGHDEKHNEMCADRLLEKMPSLRLRRSNGLIYLAGSEDHIKFEFYCGSGVCDRVQVGTRHIEEHDEPIYEVRCHDDLAVA